MAILIPQRVTRSKLQAAEYYSAIGRFYDLLSGGAETSLRDEAIRCLNIRPGEILLEIGIGTGAGLRRMAESAGPAGKAVGIDLAAGMLNVAKERTADVADRAVLACADGVRLPFREAVFDSAFLSFTLELFDNPEMPIVLNECRRTLKTGGRLGIVSMALVPHPNGMTRLYSAAHAAFPVWVDCRPIDARKSVEDAGFTVLSASRRSMFALPVDIILARR